MGSEKLPSGILFVGLTIIAFCSINVQASLLYWTDFEFTRIENTECSLLKTNLKVRHYNRTNFAINGTLEIKSYLTDEWEMGIVILYSAKGNNQFVRSPYQFTRQDLCKFLDGPVTRRGHAHRIAAASDLPAPQEDKSLCELWKIGIYTIKDLMYGQDAFFKYFPQGLYKIEASVYKKNSNESADFVDYIRFY